MKNLAAVVAILAFAVACSVSADLADTPRLDLAGSTVVPAATVSPVMIAHGPAADDQIVLLSGDGDLLVVAADGSDPVVVGSASDASISSPVWAPDGSRIAWTEVQTGALGGVDMSLVTANIDGSDPTRITTPFASFYSYWDPTSRTVAILGDDPDGVGLGFVHADRDGNAEQLDTASPYYIVWDPKGQTMLAHAGDSLRIIVPFGPINRFTIGSGLYQSPGLGGDQEIVFAEGADELGELKLGNPDTGAIATMVGYQGNAWLEVDPTGKRVALQSTGRLGTPVEGELDPLADLDFEVLPRGVDIVDIATKQTTHITNDLAAAYFWSPDGDTLLLASVEAVDDALWLQWNVWSDSGLDPIGELFQPSPMLGRTVMPFFDQYSLSHSLWAPDSSRFTYAGIAQSGERGVWVVDATTGATTLIAEDAVLSFWSPT